MQSIYCARKRAKQMEFESALSAADAESLWARCGGKCEVTGIPFSMERPTGKNVRRPWAPSIDQIESGNGYGLSNIRVVCISVNLAMNQWGEDVLHRIAVGLIKRGHLGAKLQPGGRHTTILPADVRMYQGVNSVRYLARARDFGREDHLGYFQTIEEALIARRKWAEKNKSAKVFRQLFDYTQDAEFLRIASTLSPD